MLKSFFKTMLPDTRVTAVVPQGGRYRYLTLGKKGKRFTITASGITSSLPAFGTPVITLADGPRVRCAVVRTPLLDEGGIRDWLFGNQEQVFPPTLDMGDFMHGWQVVGCSGEEQTLLFCSAWPGRVDEAVHAFDPVALGAGCTDLFTAFALLQEGFLDGNKAVVEYDGTTARVLMVEDGAIAFTREVYRSDEAEMTDDTLTFTDDLTHTLTGFWEEEEGKAPLDTVYLCGSGNLRELRNIITPALRCPVEPTCLELDGSPVAPGDVMCLGLCLKYYHPEVTAIDLLPEANRLKHADSRERKRAFRFGAWAAAACAGLLALLIPAYFIVGAVRGSLEADMLENRVAINAMEKVVAKNGRMRVAAGNLHRLLGMRTGTARVLAELNGVIPEDVWLKRVELVADGGEGAENGITVEGYALTGEAISALLGNFETADGFTGPRLLVSEKLSSKKVYRLSGRRRRREVFQFKIIVNKGSQ